MVLSKEAAANILIGEKNRFLEYYVDYGSVADAYDMAIESLRAESKTYKPVAEKAMYDYGSWHYVCGCCSKPIDIVDSYCRHCGRPVEH